jgi:hypothetical protein
LTSILFNKIKESISRGESIIAIDAFEKPGLPDAFGLITSVLQGKEFWKDPSLYKMLQSR